MSNVSNYTGKKFLFCGWKPNTTQKVTNINKTFYREPNFDLLRPLRRWLDSIEIDGPKLARNICEMIPAQCPFEREIKFFGKTVLRIPPLCKLNPLYNEVVALRFRAICYLADKCGEDVSAYC